MKKTISLIACGLLCCLSVLSSPASAVELVVDGSFEGGSPSTAWTEASTNFGSPLCNEAICGTGGQASGATTTDGAWWAWFGGIGTTEVGSVMQQSLAFPVGTATLSFDYFNTTTDSTQDFVEVTLDGTTVWSDNGATPGTAYAPIVINIDSYADGGTHDLTVRSEIFGVNGAGSNFWIDNVSIDAIAIPEPSTSVFGLFALLGMFIARRR